jgi:hypothetical protein
LNEFLGMPVTVDPHMPLGTAELRDRDGRVMARIVDPKIRLGGREGTGIEPLKPTKTRDEVDP